MARGTVTIAEAQPTVLAGFEDQTVRAARRALRRAGVRELIGRRIVGVEAGTATLEGGERVPFDILIWSGGVQASPLVDSLPVVLDRGRISVTEATSCVPSVSDLEIEDRVYAVGDVVCIHRPEGGTVPWVAPAAIEQGAIAADNILAFLSGRKGWKRRYEPHPYPYLIPLGRRDGIGRIGAFVVRGRLAILLHRLIELHYLQTVMPFRKAFSLWWKAQ